MLISTASPLITLTRPGKKQKRSGSDNPLKGLKQQTSQLEQNNAYFLEKSGMLKLGLSLVAMTVAASVRLKLWFIAQKDLRKGLTRSCYLRHHL